MTYQSVPQTFTFKTFLFFYHAMGKLFPQIEPPLYHSYPNLSTNFNKMESAVDNSKMIFFSDFLKLCTK